jgi:hypothetical protein
MFIFEIIMGIEDKIKQALSQHVPEAAVIYCLDLWKKIPFHFYITKSRGSKLGDFRYRSDKKFQTITINYDLNIYQFLITYLHEFAHHLTFSQFEGKIKPHGVEWKRNFQKILQPMLKEEVFPIDILIPLRRYALNPLASTLSDPFLAREVNKYNKGVSENPQTPLFQIPIGAQFLLSGRKFQKETPRRTRVICVEIATGKKYLISSHAEVTAID